jgi:hypothetical protein
MRLRAGAVLAALLVCALAIVPQAGASTRPVTQVRAVYRKVLTAEYFGPASAVCSRLAPSGKRSFTVGYPSCFAAFKAQQHVLRHKTPGIDNSGYTPRQWRRTVRSVMAHLRVRVHGAHAAAIGGESGIPGRTTLVKRSRGWLFTSYPPSIQP